MQPVVDKALMRRELGALSFYGRKGGEGGRGEKEALSRDRPCHSDLPKAMTASRHIRPLF